MLARIWTGRIAARDSDRYLRLMRDIALRDYRDTPGCRGAWCLHRRDGSETIVRMLSFWDSEEAVRAFAGEEIDKARYYDFDAGFLKEMPPFVEHFGLVGACPPPGGNPGGGGHDRC